MKVLFLDDLRPIPEMYLCMRDVQVTVARNFDEFKTLIDTQNFDEISFDHDLGDVKSGYDAVTYLEYKIRMEKYPVPSVMVCHSANPSGRQRINQVIDGIFYWNSMR